MKTRENTALEQIERSTQSINQTIAVASGDRHLHNTILQKVQGLHQTATKKGNQKRTGGPALIASPAKKTRQPNQPNAPSNCPAAPLFCRY